MKELDFLSKKLMIRIYLVLIMLATVLKIVGFEYISDQLILGLYGFVSVLIGLSNWDKQNKTKGRKK